MSTWTALPLKPHHCVWLFGHELYHSIHFLPLFFSRSDDALQQWQVAQPVYCTNITTASPPDQNCSHRSHHSKSKVACPLHRRAFYPGRRVASRCACWGNHIGISIYSCMELQTSLKNLSQNPQLPTMHSQSELNNRCWAQFLSSFGKFPRSLKPEYSTPTLLYLCLLVCKPQSKMVCSLCKPMLSSLW